MFKYIMLLSLVSCGNSINIPKKVEVESKKPIEVEPVVVDVDVPDTTQTIVHTIDVTASSELFRAQCEEEFELEEEIEACMSAKVAEFVQSVINQAEQP